MGPQQVAKAQRLLVPTGERAFQAHSGSHPAIIPYMPTVRVSGIGRMVKVADSFFVKRRLVWWSRATVVHPAGGLAKDFLFSLPSFRIAKTSMAEEGGKVACNAHGKEPEIGLSELELFGFRPEFAIEFHQRFSGLGTWMHGDDQSLFQQRLGVMAVVPGQIGGHGGMLAILVGQPAKLADVGRRGVAPKVDPHRPMMRKPDAAMMVVVGSTRMAHTRKRLAGRTSERVKERPRIVPAEVPAEAFLAIYFEGHLVIR